MVVGVKMAQVQSVWTVQWSPLPLVRLKLEWG